MARPFSDYTGQFFWDFKRMDNVNYNFEIVEVLYQAKKRDNNDSRYNKPITLLLIAMIECMLYDFVTRVRGRTTDPLPNVTTQVISFFRDKREADELKILIPQVEKQNLLRAAVNDTIYADLENLRQVRNRIHIQNKHRVLHRDESHVFTAVTLQCAERCFERVCETLCNVYPRWNSQPLPMKEFPRPWA